MAHANTVKLLEKLYANTKFDMIDWQDDPFYSGYSVNFTNGKCRVFFDDFDIAHFAIHNKEDEVIDEIKSDDESDQSAFDLDNIVELYTMAKRKALNADQIIDQLIKEVDNLEIPF